VSPTNFPGVPPVPEFIVVPQADAGAPPAARAVPEEAPPAVLPVPQALEVPQVLPLQDRPTGGRRKPDPALALLSGLRAVGGWLWRWAAGAVLCATGVYLLTYFTAVVVVGWTYRWMQGLVLLGLWRQSPLRQKMTFQEFCDSLGPDGPKLQPRWFLRERIREVLHRPGPGGRAAGPVRLFCRVVSLPVHSLWRNFSLGVQALLCDAFVLGWGSLFMLIGWEFGWLNSFHKGYEQSIFGPSAYFFGGLLLILGLFYVPMAQAHQAVTGQARAFFEFRFVWRLVRARLGRYVGLALLIVFASFAFSLVRMQALDDRFAGNDSNHTPLQGRDAYRLWLLGISLFVLFPLLLLLRYTAAQVYRSAVLKVLQRGTVTRGELHPVLGRWLDQLEIKIVPTAATTGIGWWARLTTRWAMHRILFTILFFVWFVYFGRVFAQYFLVADPITAFVNHPMIELPNFDLIPRHLYFGENE
jgi:hypothetical protein